MLVAIQYSAASKSLAQCRHGENGGQDDGQDDGRFRCQTCHALAKLGSFFSHINGLIDISASDSIKKLGLLAELREGFAASLASTDKAKARNAKAFVKVTRMLGYRYLWIDTLCLLQDDEEEWRNASLTMASVYRN
jgi:hypothetical protein